jgi:hypothetical protein
VTGAEVSANPPKNDAWRPYADVRFVLIRNAGRLKPSRGLILDWKREGRHWQALVVWHDDASLKPVVKMDWLRIGRSSAEIRGTTDVCRRSRAS